MTLPSLSSFSDPVLALCGVVEQDLARTFHKVKVRHHIAIIHLERNAQTYAARQTDKGRPPPPNEK